MRVVAERRKAATKYPIRRRVKALSSSLNENCSKYVIGRDDVANPTNNKTTATKFPPRYCGKLNAAKHINMPPIGTIEFNRSNTNVEDQKAMMLTPAVPEP